mgnify:CR=1 FL=1
MKAVDDMRREEQAKLEAYKGEVATAREQWLQDATAALQERVGTPAAVGVLLFLTMVIFSVSAAGLAPHDTLDSAHQTNPWTRRRGH